MAQALPVRGMRGVVPIILPEASFEEQARFLWDKSTRLYLETDAGTVVVTAYGQQDVRSLFSGGDSVTHAFRRVPDFMDLASFSQWFVPFSVFMRLACFHLHLSRVRSNCNSHLLKMPKHQNDLYWTFWLHTQGIDHQRYFV